jgi:hypothetical protein
MLFLFIVCPGVDQETEEKMRFSDLFRSNLAFSSDCVVKTAESMFWAVNHLRTCYLIRDLISGILVKSNQLPFVQIFPLVPTSESRCFLSLISDH